MSNGDIEDWLNVVKFLTKDLKMALFSKNRGYEVYRKEIKSHIVTVTIKMDSGIDGPDIITQLNINGTNIWWHEFDYHSGYTVESISDFDSILFTRAIINNSNFFKEIWKNNADF